jgi:CDP-paratose 2-epimerase
MRLLVTGACGFVGSTLIRTLLAAIPGLEVVGLDNFLRDGSRGNVEPLRRFGVEVVEGDIRSEDDLTAIGRVDWVLDCAAEPSVLAGVGGAVSAFGVMDHNLIGTLRVLEFCKRHGAGLVLLSTSRVYSIAPLASLAVEAVDGAFAPAPGACGQTPGLSGRGIAESFSTVPPLSLYGVSKRCAELVALEYADAFGFPVWINRCGVLAGAGQFGKADQGIAAYWIRAWRDRKPLRYIGFGGAGAQVRDFLHPRDLTRAIERQFAAGAHAPVIRGDGVDPRICNFAGGLSNACSLANLSDWCRDRFGPHEVGSDPMPRPFDLPWVVLDATRAAETWDWKPVTPLSGIFAEIAES